MLSNMKINLKLYSHYFELSTTDCEVGEYEGAQL